MRRSNSTNVSKMSTINSYLTFNGNCREAMTFYQQCLGGELAFQTIGESPLSEKMPKRVKDYILHSTLTNGSLLLMGSDMAPEAGLIKGNGVSLILNSGSEKELKSYYKKLSAGGQETHPLQKNFWGVLFGGLTDKYGNHWLLNSQQEQTKTQNITQNEQ
jgi:PhnB protein